MAQDTARRGCFNRNLAQALARQVNDDMPVAEQTGNDLPMTVTALENIGVQMAADDAPAPSITVLTGDNPPIAPINVTGLNSLAPADQKRFINLAAIIFDVDDTLIYSDPDIITAFLNAATSVGLHLNRTDVVCVLKNVAWPRFEREGMRFADDQPGMLRFFITTLLEESGVKDTDTAEKMFQSITATVKSKSYPDAVLALRALHNQGLAIAAITGRLHSTEDVLTELGIRKYFDFYTYAGKHKVAKLTPDFYQHAVDALQLDPEQIALIDDEPKALNLAKELGFLTFMIDRDGRKEAEPNAAGLYRLDRLDRLNDLLAAARLRFG